MLYTDLVRQASVLSGYADFYADSNDGTAASRAFEILLTSMLALNTDDRLTFAVDDIEIDLIKNKLALVSDSDYVPLDDEQVYIADWPIEIPPAYIIRDPKIKMQAVQYDLFLRSMPNMNIYSVRIDFGKAIIHFGCSGRIKMGLKKPLDLPKQITDTVKMTGSALNLVMYKLAKDICAYSRAQASPELDLKYAECINRHTKVKADILAPPILTLPAYRRRL